MANSSLRNEEGTWERLSTTKCPKSPAGYRGGIHPVVSESITQMIENQRLHKVSWRRSWSDGFCLGLGLVFNAGGVGQKWRLTRHCKYCHNGLREERREPVKLQTSTKKPVGRVLEGNQRFSATLRWRCIGDWCNLSKAALGREGKVGLISPRDREAEGEKLHANSWERKRRERKGQHEARVTTVQVIKQRL